jgi:putative transposase
MKDAYTAAELAVILDMTRQAVQKRAKKDGWPVAKDGKRKPFVTASLPPDIRAKIAAFEAAAQAEATLPTKAGAPLAVIPTISERKERGALAKVDLVRIYADWLARGRGGKMAARKSFAAAYESGAWPTLRHILGAVSWQTVERWQAAIEERGQLAALVDQRGGHNRGASSISEEHAQILLGKALHPNQPHISEVLRRAVWEMERRGLPVPSERTMRRYIETWIAEHYAQWTYMREGKKAWNDKCAYNIARDSSRIEVGDILFADGHKLNFEIVNPWTGKAQRMELVLWYDMASNMPLGWEVMPSEDTQAIASAFRRALITLGKAPRIAFLDNGRAFRGKYFNGVDLKQTGIGGLIEQTGAQVAFDEGIFSALGVDKIFAWEYHGQSKPIERFFKTFGE